MSARRGVWLLAGVLAAATTLRGADDAPERQAAIVEYPDHTNVGEYRDERSLLKPIRSLDDWKVRREHIVANVERVMGPFPRDRERLPLDVRVHEEVRDGGLVRRKIDFRSDAATRVPAWVLIPEKQRREKKRETERLPTVLCLHQTTEHSKDEPVGLGGDAELKYALELAERGFVTISPDYPSFGEYEFNFEKSEHPSGSMKAIWDNSRAVDVLETMPEVDPERIGVIGHSLGGHNAIFTALFEPRIKAVVSSCGFTAFQRDDMPSWTGPRYMPRIAGEFGNDAGRMPFDFHELAAALAPRSFLACAAQHDDDFDVSGVREVIAAARSIYELHGAAERLEALYPPAAHSFPRETRQSAYEFLEKWLAP